MDLSDADNIRLTAFPPRLTCEERDVLDSLYLCHEKGPGPHHGPIRIRRILSFLAVCLAIAAGLVRFANLIPPLFSALVAGFIIGVLFMVARRETAFQRVWRLYDMIIDWKTVERMRGKTEQFADLDA